MKRGPRSKGAMAAALCIGQAAASAMPSAGYEYRPDAAGGAASGKCGCGVGGGEKTTPVNVASKGFFWPPSITRFPPNFVRQASIKARRNCSNIGVAQVVAASATDCNTPASAVAAAALSSAHAEVVNGPLELAGNGSAVVPAAAYEAPVDPFPSGDAEKFDRKKSSTLAVHGGEQIWLHILVSALMLLCGCLWKCAGFDLVLSSCY